ncbi:hypothetical protein M407DRAFT_30283 [Tulasnella calospora MUT 4182]|uniref:CFEM domain-containing protein n=1 Tax=Tulasnella calospora MUT 4182 TaxID=1051891 RepID=A0A0C3PXZ9_9AGAM|nr:hypothetical protein M407DRAFT_30283 [Tulasnella calospora MUT 4182]
MRFLIVVLFVASIVSAASMFKRHNNIEVPRCAKDCVARTDPSPCKPDDAACLCVNAKYSEEVGTCVQDKCNPEDAQAAAEAGIEYCKAVGIDLDNPWPSNPTGAKVNFVMTAVLTAAPYAPSQVAVSRA